MNLVEYPSKVLIVCRNSKDLRGDLMPAATRSTSIEEVDSTSRALQVLQDASAEMIGIPRVFEADADFRGADWQAGDLLLKVRLPPLSEVVGRAESRRPISVAILVQPMLDEDGVAFLEAAGPYSAKRLLMTETGSISKACSLFNRRLVDSILFTDADRKMIKSEVVLEVERLRTEYFESFGSLTIASAVEPDFAGEPMVGRLLAEIKRKLDSQEHYISIEPPGFLIFNGNGEPFFLFLCSDEYIRAHRDIAAEQGAPEQMLEDFESGRNIGWFPTRSGFFEEGMSGDWPEFVWKTSRIGENSLWNFVLVHRDFNTQHLFDRLLGAVK